MTKGVLVVDNCQGKNNHVNPVKAINLLSAIACAAGLNTSQGKQPPSVKEVSPNNSKVIRLDMYNMNGEN